MTEPRHERTLKWPVAIARRAYRAVSRRLLDPNRVKLRQVENRGLQLLVWQNEDIGRRLILLKRFEDAELDFVLGFVGSGDTCIDVGANIGYFALPLARACGTAGSVLCFEPVRRNVLTIRLAAEINHLSNLEVVEAAVVETSRSLKMDVSDADSAYTHVAAANAVLEGVVVSGVTLDEMVDARRLDRIKFLKIDVEGAENIVLAGAGGLLADPQRRPEFMMVELVPSHLARFGTTIEALVARLAAYDYRAFVLIGGRLRALEQAHEGQLINTFFLDRRMRARLSL